MTARLAIVALALVAWTGRADPPPAPLPLAEAITQALAGNRELATAAMNLGLGDLAVGDALNAFALTWRPEGAAAATDAGSAARVGLSATRRTAVGAELGAGLAVDDYGPDAAVRRAGSLRVELRQPLLRGRGSAVQLDDVFAARAGRQTARRSFEARRPALVLAVVQAHQELARLQAQLAYDEQAVQRYARLRRLTQAREQQGRASRVDSLRVEFQYGQAESALTATRERLDAQRGDLCELLGRPPDAPLAVEPGPPLRLDDAPAAAAVALALSNRLDYAEALQAVGEARRGIRVARQRVLPTVDLVARYGRNGTGDSIGDALDLPDETWSVGLAGDSDLHRRAERSALQRELIGAAAAEEDLLTLENRIRREVQQAVQAYARAAQQTELDARNLELARDRARLARRLFELGRGDNFTATDAEAELLRAQSRQLENESDITVAAFQLKQATGTLVESPDELKPRPPVPAVMGQVGP